jgi:hypothetical protein
MPIGEGRKLEGKLKAPLHHLKLKFKGSIMLLLMR